MCIRDSSHCTDILSTCLSTHAGPIMLLRTSVPSVLRAIGSCLCRKGCGEQIKPRTTAVHVGAPERER
eukprot:4272209-Alexandrium_andersonii.AAC.1